jgi:hypothetical protein
VRAPWRIVGSSHTASAPADRITGIRSCTGATSSFGCGRLVAVSGRLKPAHGLAVKSFPQGERGSDTPSMFLNGRGGAPSVQPDRFGICG